MDFKIESAYKPTGDQPQAIEELCDGLKNGADYQTLLGVTGSGKTFTMANVIERVNRPTLICRTTKRLPPSCMLNSNRFSPKTLSIISFPTTTTTNPRHTFHRPTNISRRT